MLEVPELRGFSSRPRGRPSPAPPPPGSQGQSSVYWTHFGRPPRQSLHFCHDTSGAYDPPSANPYPLSAGQPMSSPKFRQALAEKLQNAAASYQDAHVVHRCATCAKPCCRLDSHVLELNWKQVKVFWRLEESRAAFDRRLSSGKGPEEIRAGDGLYFIHRKVCPAYDETRRSCRVYDQELKPAGCTDYPVYDDGDCIIADLRCEAVDIDVLAAWIARAVGPEFRVVRSADKDFPFLVSLSVRRLGARPKSRDQRSGSG